LGFCHPEFPIEQWQVQEQYDWYNAGQVSAFNIFACIAGSNPFPSRIGLRQHLSGTMDHADAVKSLKSLVHMH
jgi:hypothetical protein